MAETLLQAGDELEATVVDAKPFGAFVRTDDGVVGLVRGARADIGSRVRVRVVEFDAPLQRFSAIAV